jgi:DNA replication protein DnaC
MARFPLHKNFDFRFQPSIDPKVVKELATGRFIADSDNFLRLGPRGVGKTHLGMGLGSRPALSSPASTTFVHDDN